MSRAAIMPTLGVGEQVHAGCFSLLVGLIAPEETEEPAGDLQRPSFTVAAVKEEDRVEDKRERVTEVAWEDAGRNRGLDLEPREKRRGGEGEGGGREGGGRVDVDAHEDKNRRHDTLFRTIESLEPTSTIIEEAIKAIGPEANNYGCTSQVCFEAKRGHQMPERSPAG